MVSLNMSPSQGPGFSIDEISEAGLSSEVGSIGDDETTGINSGVLNRETSPVGYAGRSQSPRLINRCNTQVSMFPAPKRIIAPNMHSTPKLSEHNLDSDE